MPSAPVALMPALPSELITYILAQYSPSRSTTLLICQPRAAFLSSLLECIPVPQHPEDDNSTDDQLEESPSRHQLLVPTLQQIAASRSIKLVFIPTLSHLRAYLALRHTEKKNSVAKQSHEQSGEESLRLVVYGLLALHKDTSEWSAQGLGQTLAGLVEAGKRTQSSIIIVEPKRNFDLDDVLQEDEETNELSALRQKRRQQFQEWEEEVPVLSGGGRKGGLEAGWSGRMVEVGRIAARWFQFERGDWND